MSINGKMTDGDVKSAACALIDWLESQRILQHDAVRVLTITTIAIIKQIAATNGLDAKEGGRIVADIIVKSFP